MNGTIYNVILAKKWPKITKFTKMTITFYREVIWMSSFHHWAAFLKHSEEITILAISMLPLAISIMAKLAIFGKNGHFGHTGHGQWQYVYDHYGYLLKDIQKCRSLVKTRRSYDSSIKSYDHFCEFVDFRPFFLPKLHCKLCHSQKVPAQWE